MNRLQVFARKTYNFLVFWLEKRMREKNNLILVFWYVVHMRDSSLPSTVVLHSAQYVVGCV